jgi:hypothetical protein
MTFTINEILSQQIQLRLKIILRHTCIKLSIPHLTVFIMKFARCLQSGIILLLFKLFKEHNEKVI